MDEEKICTLHLLLLGGQVDPEVAKFGADAVFDEIISASDLTMDEAIEAFKILMSEEIIDAHGEFIEDPQEEPTPWGEYAAWFIVCVGGGILYAYLT